MFQRKSIFTFQIDTRLNILWRCSSIAFAESNYIRHYNSPYDLCLSSFISALDLPRTKAMQCVTFLADKAANTALQLLFLLKRIITACLSFKRLLDEGCKISTSTTTSTVIDPARPLVWHTCMYSFGPLLLNCIPSSLSISSGTQWKESVFHVVAFEIITAIESAAPFRCSISGNTSDCTYVYGSELQLDFSINFFGSSSLVFSALNMLPRPFYCRSLMCSLWYLSWVRLSRARTGSFVCITLSTPLKDKRSSLSSPCARQSCAWCRMGAVFAQLKCQPWMSWPYLLHYPGL